MNIILSMPNDNQSNNYIINALQDMGYEVFFFDHRNQMEACRDMIPKFLTYYKIDLVMVLYLVPGKTYDVEFLRTLKMISPQTKFISWIFDVIITDKEFAYENEEFINIVKEYDFFFTVAEGHIEEFRKRGVNAFWAREGFCPYSHYPIYHIEGNKRIYYYDVSFIGQMGHENVHSDRVLLMKEIAKKFTNIAIYGVFTNLPEEIKKYHKGRPTYNDTEHNKIVGMSRINIGNSGWIDNNKYMSARNYRVCAAGGFLLANHSKGIENTYSNDEIGIYNNFDDCIEKIDYYLKNKEEREKMADKAYERTIKEYTFKHSLEKILEEIYGNREI